MEGECVMVNGDHPHPGAPTTHHGILTYIPPHKDGSLNPEVYALEPVNFMGNVSPGDVYSWKCHQLPQGEDCLPECNNRCSLWPDGFRPTESHQYSDKCGVLSDAKPFCESSDIVMDDLGSHERKKEFPAGVRHDHIDGQNYVDEICLKDGGCKKVAEGNSMVLPQDKVQHVNDVLSGNALHGDGDEWYTRERTDIAHLDPGEFYNFEKTHDDYGVVRKSDGTWEWVGDSTKYSILRV